MAGIGLDDEARKEIFRKFAGTAIENSHAAIKQVWVAIFAGGTFQLIRSFDNLMGCLGIFSGGGTNCGLFIEGMKSGGPFFEPDFWLVILLYVIYVLTFYRFYVGNIRVFDVRYIEVGKFVALIAEKFAAEAKKKTDRLRSDQKTKKLRITGQARSETDALYDAFFSYNNGLNRVGDSIFLIFKTLAIVSLTIEINDPKVFINIYLIVIVLDLLWMMFGGLWSYFFGHSETQASSPASFWAGMKQGWKDFSFDELLFGKNPFLTTKYFEFLKLRTALEEREKDGAADLESISQTDLEKIFPSRAIRKWAANSLICSLLLLALIVPCGFASLPGGSRLPYWLAVAIMLFNCGRDLFLTWGFYNPTFQKAHDLITGRKRSNQSRWHRFTGHFRGG